MRARKVVARPLLAAILAVAALGTALLTSPMAEAQTRRRNRGLDITLGLGAGGCTDLYCAGLDMSAQTKLEVLFRVVRYLSVGAHMGFQFGAPDRNLPGFYDLGWSMVVGPEVRGILPVGRLEAWLGVVSGFMRMQIEQENDDRNQIDVAWMNGFALGFGFGAQYFVHRRVAVGLDFWLYKGLFDKAHTYENDGNPTVETSRDMSRSERAAVGVVFTVGAVVTFFIPL